MIVSVSAETLTPERELKSFFTGLIFGLGISLIFKAIFSMNANKWDVNHSALFQQVIGSVSILFPTYYSPII